MQAYYSYFQARDAAYNMGLEKIEEHFQPDLNSMEVQDKTKLRAQTKVAKDVLRKWYEDGEVENLQDAAINDCITDVKDSYHNQLNREVRNIKKFMVRDIENLSTGYVKLLLFIVELSDFVSVEDSEKKNKRYTEDESPNLAFLESPFIKALREDETITKRIQQKNIHWGNHQSIIRNAYKKQLITSDNFKAFIEDNSRENEISLLKFIVKQIIFKNELIDELFEEEDLHWDENKNILKSLCSKTINNLDASGEWQLLAVSASLEEDQEYFEKLFDEILNLDEASEEALSKHLVNWDVERVSITDKLIIKMALAEMISFPSIPVKVSINEYIELSKNYSTPKSKQFVNGLLDKISKEYIDAGKIKKSGRGLIDNK